MPQGLEVNAVSTTKNSGAADDVTPAGVRHGAVVYENVLGRAGGSELMALMRGEDRSAVCAAIYQSPPYDLEVPALPVARLSINLTRSRVSGHLDGDRRRSHEADRYSLFLAPQGAAATWRKEAPSRHLTIYFDADAFAAGDDGARRSPLADPLLNASLPGTRRIVDELAAELDHPGILSAESADSLARLLLVALARRLDRTARRDRPLGRPLLARLRDHVMAHLAEPIRVADLAAHAGLGPNRFAAVMREQTGRSPHQFVLALRLEHATDLLRHSRLPLAEVAHACGFANQQHLTNTMRRGLGTTPSRYRDGCGAAAVDAA